MERAADSAIRKLEHPETSPLDGDKLLLQQNQNNDVFSTFESIGGGISSSNVNLLSWDFVPDGLLVWKAWQTWISKTQQKN